MTLTHIQSARVVAAVSRPGIGLFNITLGAAVLLLLMYYVMQTNLAAASSWQLTDAHDRLLEIRVLRDNLIAHTAQLDDRETLTGLATSQGMVPSGAVVYLVQPDPVAAR